MNIIRLVFLVLLTVAVSACGTSMNMAIGQKPYGGVTLDKVVLENSIKAKDPATWGLGAAAVVDIPLSLVGDTLTAPICVLSGRPLPKRRWRPWSATPWLLQYAFS